MRLAILAVVVACGSKPPPSSAPPRTTVSTDAGADETHDGSDETALDAKRWAYAPFFTHLKQAIYTEWKPSTVWKALASVDRPHVDTLTTEVRITLLPDGTVSTVAVTKPCGVPAIDDECVRAVTAAGPFSNPPAELVKDGVIAFPFTFYFEVKSAGP